MVHEKIINFLQALSNLEVSEGREAIVNNLFGVGTRKAPTADYKLGGVKLI